MSDIKLAAGGRRVYVAGPGGRSCGWMLSEAAVFSTAASSSGLHRPAGRSQPDSSAPNFPSPAGGGSPEKCLLFSHPLVILVFYLNHPGPVHPPA